MCTVAKTKQKHNGKQKTNKKKKSILRPTTKNEQTKSRKQKQTEEAIPYSFISVTHGKITSFK